MIKIIDNQNRKELHEGRNFGLAFAFLKKSFKNTFETVMPISCCKDYLNDVLYTEYTKDPCSAHGLNCKSQLNIEDNGKFYMIIKILNYKYDYANNRPYEGNDYSYKKDKILLQENHKSMEMFINDIEKKLRERHSISFLTSINKITNDDYMITFDKFWTEQGHLISLYTLLLRLSLYEKYNPKKHKNYIDYLLNYNNSLDYHLLESTFYKIIKLIETDWFPVIDYQTLKNNKVNPHGLGIQWINNTIVNYYNNKKTIK